MADPFVHPCLAQLPRISGLAMAACGAGIKYADRDDLMLMTFCPGTTAAGLLTRSSLPAAPVLVTRENLEGGSPRVLVVNSGNANAFTGSEGLEHCRMIGQAAARSAGCEPKQVLMASTGVIGEPLPAKRIVRSIPGLVRDVQEADWLRVARAIMTTDTFPKGATVPAEIDGKAVTLCGIAKGSGMIAPDMATMLAFCFTDASIPAGTLKAMLAESAGRTFNAITVDGDTSTSDMLLLFATGTVGNAPPRSADDPRLMEFRTALDAVLKDLALQVVRDGEGASKLIEVRVRGAETDSAARQIAEAVANSPLVKTAIAGGDANWGRVIMAVGKSGQKVVPEDLVLKIGGETVARGGSRSGGYDEGRITRHLEGVEVLIEIDIGIGNGRFTMWTCDLTHGYISINADYRS